jgi:hypothetical protein
VFLQNLALFRSPGACFDRLSTNGVRECKVLTFIVCSCGNLS